MSVISRPCSISTFIVYPYHTRIHRIRAQTTLSRTNRYFQINLPARSISKLCTMNFNPFSNKNESVYDDKTLQLRARGCLLGLMIGDALGAGVEGWTPQEIVDLSIKMWDQPLIQDFFPAVHMGTFVFTDEPDVYEPARPLDPRPLLPTGPPANDAIANQCCRVGMYSDDTNTSLALAASIVDQGHVDATVAARYYSEYWRNSDIVRGCPPTAQKIMLAVLDGASVDQVGLPPYFPYENGSFANGGAMRISPLAIAYREADKSNLRSAVEKAIRASHRHPEAIDFAVVQASAVQYALSCKDSTHFQPVDFLNHMVERCVIKDMRDMVIATRDAFTNFRDEDYEIAVLDSVVSRVERPSSGFDFQLSSIHTMPCVLWCVCRYYDQPLRAIQVAIALGGDTDTIASMVGAIVGALHGEGEWCRHLAEQLENGEKGRDFALHLADSLSRLNIGRESQ